MNQVELMAALLEEDRERTKLAFATNAFSGPMNPNIRSGASDLPNLPPPSLQTPLKKKVAFILDLEGEFDELQKIAATSAGLWWEQIGGPFLAKGGDHKTFEKMMADAELPPGIQEKFKRVAKEKYPKGSQWAPGGGPQHAGGAGGLRSGTGLRDIAPFAAGIGSLAGVIGFAMMNKDKEKNAPKASEIRGRVGAQLMSTPAGVTAGIATGTILSLLGKANPRTAPIIGGAIGAAVGAGMGEWALHSSRKHIEEAVAKKLKRITKLPELKQERAVGKLERSAAKTTRGDVLDQATQRALGLGAGIATMRLIGGKGALEGLGSALKDHVAMTGIMAAGGMQGSALLRQYESRSIHDKVQKGLKEFKKAAGLYKLEGDAVIEVDKDGKSLGKGPVKMAASAPTRGNFMMASDIPPLRVPSLRTGIEKGSEMLPDYVTYGSGDFKPARLNEKKASMSPFTAAAQAKTVGSPRVTALPGPSIAEVAKPKGAGFGSGMAGALKNTTSGSAPVNLQASSPGSIK